MIQQTAIPQEEIDVFKTLEDLQVIFDVGARVDVDYLAIWPDSEYHLFEPNPEFFEELKKRVGDRPNVHLNNYGLGDQECDLYYHPSTQKMSVVDDGSHIVLHVRTLNDYLRENNITRIDFLKIDTEQMDYRVLIGGTDAIRIAKYIQYETWNAYENEIMEKLLKDDFDMTDIGYRNILCKRKKLNSQN